MIIPVRCITCGRPISNKWGPYKEQVSKGKNAKKVLDELGIKNYCCRSLFLTHVDLIDEISEFKNRLVPKSDEVVEAEVVVIPPPSIGGPESEAADEEDIEEELPKTKKKEE